MDRKPPVDPSFFIPIFIAGCSVFGIMLVLLGLRLSASRGTVQTLITTTPVKFQYLGTEPGIAQPTEVPPAEETMVTPEITEAPTEIFLPPTATISIEETPIFLATNTLVTNTVTSQPLGITYDDADPIFTYTGNWIGQSGVNNTYKNTLHISSTIGDAVQLVFYGQRIRLTYQAGPSLGTVAIKLDSTDSVLDQSAIDTRSSEWESSALSLSNHTITITHISGGSVNIDSALVMDTLTPTPTATPTPTQ
jgi:hypothetical protein